MGFVLKPEKGGNQNIQYMSQINVTSSLKQIRKTEWTGMKPLPQLKPKLGERE